MELFVAIMAMIAATVINPGVYFAMNSAAGLIGADAAHAAQVISGWGFTVTPDMLTQIAHDVGETTIMSRTGGAPTLAVGMASILSGLIGGKLLMGIWYHFAILFEALFILTTVDAGTRVCRFMIQDLVGNVVPSFKATKSWSNNVIGSAVSCALWGWFLYQGVIDPLGGIWTLWPLFGTSNQMLAAIALTTVHGGAVQDEARALRLGDDRAGSMAGRVHRDRRPAEGVQYRPGDRLPRSRHEVL